MNETMQIILNKIKEYDKIFIFRHFRPDGDAIGSTNGLATILKNTYPEKEIHLQNADFSDYLAFLGKEEELLPDEEYKDALGIVLDTATKERISNQKYALCKELIKIDHHIPIQSYANYEWVEEHRSSLCEQIVAFYDAFKDELKMDKKAATFLYVGMVTDSGRFRFREVSGETMRLAGILLDTGIDLDVLYANLYMQSFESLKYKAYIFKSMKITENGVAYFYVSNEMQKKLGLSREEASAGISAIENIAGSLIWIAFIENEDKSIRVRLRSRFVTVSPIGEKYHGGGHACASGATVYSKKELNALVKDADARLKEYKENNEGWL